MKKLIVCVILFMTGCTSPSQRIAVTAIQRGADQEHAIVIDLATMAKQSAVDNGVAQVKQAVAAQDANAAQAAVEKAVTQFDKIAWLQIQHERARSMIRLAQNYIWAQEGIFDILAKEVQQSIENAKEKTPEQQ